MLTCLRAVGKQLVGHNLYLDMLAFGLSLVLNVRYAMEVFPMRLTFTTYYCSA